jgi:hypothetical protein
VITWVQVGVLRPNDQILHHFRVKSSGQAKVHFETITAHSNIGQLVRECVFVRACVCVCVIVCVCVSLCVCVCVYIVLVGLTGGVTLHKFNNIPGPLAVAPNVCFFVARPKHHHLSRCGQAVCYAQAPHLLLLKCILTCFSDISLPRYVSACRTSCTMFVCCCKPKQTKQLFNVASNNNYMHCERTCICSSAAVSSTWTGRRMHSPLSTFMIICVTHTQHTHIHITHYAEVEHTPVTYFSRCH